MEQKYKTSLKVLGAVAASGLLIYILSHKPNKNSRHNSKRTVDRIVENEPFLDESMFGDVPYSQNLQ